MLVGPAKAAHDQMLLEVRSDGLTSINSSKMINWIISDYFDRFFTRRKSQLVKEHFNSRKCVLEAMKTGDPEALKRALKAASKNLAPKSKHSAKEKGKSVAVIPEKIVD